MSAALHVSPNAPAPQAPDMHDAIGEALAAAESYPNTGTQFAFARVGTSADLTSLLKRGGRQQ